MLTPLWFIYCLLVYPIQRRAQPEQVEKTEFMKCWQETSPPYSKGCAEWARVEAGTELWTLRAFYARESWLLALVLVVVPLLAYGFCSVSVWVGRGFMAGV